MSSDGAAEMNALARDIAAMSARVRPLSEAALRKTGVDIQAGAQMRAPVDTGYLRSSISMDAGRDGDTYRVEVGPTANYAGHVENGTSRQRPQPYLRPATDAALPGLEQALSQLGGDLL